MGVDLDPIRNSETTNPINAPAARCSIQVLASLEDEQIARHTHTLMESR
jgi:acetate kinase